MPTGPDAVDALARVSALLQRGRERCAAEHGMSAVQARLLEVLMGRAPTMTELSRLLGLDKSSTSGLVDRGERRGLVRRVPSQLDRRSVRVRLTDQGHAVAQQLSLSFTQEVTALLAPLSPDEEGELTTCLSRVLDGSGRARAGGM